MEPVPSKKVRGDIEKSGAGPNVGKTLGGSIRAKVCLFEITSAESVLVGEFFRLRDRFLGV